MTADEKPYYDCIVLNGTVVTAADIARYDLAIKDGKIMLLAPTGHLTNTPATRVIDAEGAYVMVCCCPHQYMNHYNASRLTRVARRC
jgi:N-acyl-D-aspartate/D-glutamate deacylase